MPTVVIADDSPTLRRIVTSVLSKDGFDVVQAEDGVSAVQQVFATMPDAIVLDVQMPRVSGYVAARLLKDDWQTADIPIILLTSLDAASDRYWGAQTGADRYFTKDFEAPQLVAAVREVIDAANEKAQGRVLKADPVELADDDVMSRVCDLLDRKLFETSVASEVTALAATTHGFEQTVAGVLEVLRRFVDYDLASVLLLEERTAYVAVAQETSQAQYAELLNAAVDGLGVVSGSEMSVGDLELRLADPQGLLGEEDDERGMATFLSMPLRGHGGAVVGLLALSSGQKNAFGETALSTLRLVDGPAAIVIDNARLAGVRTEV
jgi:twitching motility two-component system response regulator PilH